MSETGDLPTPPQLYAHQLAALAASHGRRLFALSPMEMGTGKSAVIAHEARELIDAKELDLLIIVAPDGVHRKWAERELPLHGRLRAHWLRSSAARGEYQRIVKDVSTSISAGKGAAVCLGYGAVSARSEAFLLVRRLVSAHGPRTMLVLDEHQAIKTPSAKRTKTLWHLGVRCRYRRILSGTPIGKGLEDLYAPYRFLDWRIAGCQTFSEFKGEYCVMGGFEGREIVAYKREGELLGRLAPYSFAAAKADCLDLPAKIYDLITVELSTEQRRAYDLLRDEYLLEIRDGVAIDVAMAITRLLRLQQIVGGFIGERGNLRELPCPRQDVVKALVENALNEDQRVMIWARFRHEVLHLETLLKKARLGKTVTYHGGMNEDECAHALDLFQNKRQADVMIGTQSKGGTGLDLTAGNVVIYYSNTFNYIERAQSEDRCHRIGQDRSVLYNDLKAERTLDGKILSVLKKRADLAKMLLDPRTNLQAVLNEEDTWDD